MASEKVSGKRNEQCVAVQEGQRWLGALVAFLAFLGVVRCPVLFFLVTILLVPLLFSSRAFTRK
jgi:hypothetical protein